MVSKICLSYYSLALNPQYVVGTRKHLEVLLMSTHNICFHGEIRKISVFFDWVKWLIWDYVCHIYPKYLDRETWANSVDPNQMLQNAVSACGLQFATHTSVLDSSAGCKIDLFQLGQVWKRIELSEYFW